MPTVKLKINERPYAVDFYHGYRCWTRFAIILTSQALRKDVIMGNVAPVRCCVMVKEF